VSQGLAKRAGHALVWQGIQHAGGKIIYLLRIPILARLLAPDDFGLMAIAIIAVEFLMHVTNFGMIPALVQRERPDHRHYDSAWTVGLLRAGLVSAAVFLAAPWIADIFGDPRAAAVIRLLALRPLIQAAASIRVADLTRDLQFRGLAILSLSEALAASAISIALAPWYGVWALAFGSLAGPFVHMVLSYLLAPYRPAVSLDRTATAALIRFGRWIFLIGIIALAGRSVLHAVISRRLGAEALGIYFLAAKIAFLPTEISSQLIGSVAFPMYARLQSDLAGSARAFRALLSGLAAMLFPLLALLIVLAPSLVDEVLGPRWESTAPIIQLLAVVSVIGLFADSAEPIFKGLGQPWRLALLETVQATLLIAPMWYMAGRYGLLGAVACWLPAKVASQIISAVLLGRVLERPYRGLARPLAIVTAISLLGAGVAWAADRTLDGWPGFVIAGSLSTLVMGAALWVSDRRFDLGLLALIGRVFPGMRPLLGGAGSRE
jgi:O-antigen/teichoic acid export membrane protein